MAGSFSPTSIQWYFESGCPAKWKFGKDWNPKGDRGLLDLGLEVHALLESGDTVVPNGNKANYLASRIQGEMYSLGAKLLPDYNEYAQKIPVEYNGVAMTLSRRIDGIAELPDGKYVIVDYKVTGAGWHKFKKSKQTPKAENFQSAAYVISDPDDADWWPTEVWYFTVGAFNNRLEVVKYKPTKEDHTNLLSAASLFLTACETKIFPKVRGNHCVDCDFAKLCFATTTKQRMEAEKFYTRTAKRS